MAMWFTSDLHLGHQNIIRYSGRPFTDVAAMDEGLIRRWNEVVAPGDEVWVLGDMAMGQIAQSLPLVGRLLGRKVLVAGNHDRCWSGHGAKAAAWVGRYLEAGFAEVLQGQVDVALEDRTVVACHFPYEGDSQAEERFVEHRPVDTGRWLLHGHVHERWRQRGRMVNVGVDVWGYRPVSAAGLAALVAAGPADLSRLEP